MTILRRHAVRLTFGEQLLYRWFALAIVIVSVSFLMYGIFMYSPFVPYGVLSVVLSLVCFACGQMILDDIHGDIVVAKIEAFNLNHPHNEGIKLNG